MPRPGIPASATGAPIWWDNLVLNDKGGPKAILLNGDIALSQEPLFQGSIRWDAFRSQTMLAAPVPWDMAPSPRPWTDQDDYMACMWLQQSGVMLNDSAVHVVVEGIAKRSSYHPVMDFLASEPWDGVPRVGGRGEVSWLTYYLGVPDTPYVRAVGAAWLISAVARVSQPGCQADCVLILEGETGIGKTSTFRILGGAWYSNDIAVLGSKDAKEQIIGCWIMELDELDAVRRADWPSVLSFVSTSSDRFRFSYGRRVQAYPRQCVFGGTTEKDNWLPDLSGLRRWWPVKCGLSIDLDSLRRDRTQLWAEAALRYGMGEPWYLDDKEIIADAVLQQKERFDPDPWEDAVLQVIVGKDRISISELLSTHLKIPTERVTRGEAMRIGGILRSIGWVRRNLRYTDMLGKSTKQWCFISPEHPMHPKYQGLQPTADPVPPQP